MVEIPKAVVIERIRIRSGPEAAGTAGDELPDRLDLDSDKLREEFGGGSPSTG